MSPAEVGVLALQGDFALHCKTLEGLGLSTREVRTPADMVGIDALVMPGGESTTIAMGLEREGLEGPIRDLAQSGAPVFGTCAGMVLLGRDRLGLIDAEVERNAFGRQIHSFEADVDVKGITGAPVRALFIRAPVVKALGRDVEVLADVDGMPVAVRQGSVTAVSFHPELIGDSRVHELALGLHPAAAASAARV